MKLSQNIENSTSKIGVVGLIFRLFKHYLRPKIRSMLPPLACMIVASLTAGMSAFLVQPILDVAFSKHDFTMIYILTFLFVVSIVIKCGTWTYYTAKMELIGQSVLFDMQIELYSSFLYADSRFLLKYPDGYIMSRFQNDVYAVKTMVKDVASAIMVDLLTVFALVAVMLYQSVFMTFTAFICFPIVLYTLKKLARKISAVAKRAKADLAACTVNLDENISKSRIIKSYCREEYETSRAASVMQSLLERYSVYAFKDSYYPTIMHLLVMFTIAAIFSYGSLQVVNGHISPGAFFSFVISLLMLYKPLSGLANINVTLHEGLTSLQRLFEVIDMTPTIVDDKKSAVQKLHSFNIDFTNVYFGYDSNKPVLDGINLHIPEGKTVALVGCAGSGKTTIFNLLQRLYDPEFGTVSIGGYDLKSIRLSVLRESIGFVSQDIALFDGTILENIRYGKLDATEDEVIDAAMSAAAHDFITDLQDGYGTRIGSDGLDIPSGQRQRIAIARAILKNAPILLLDEATSALDSISEKQIHMALEYLKKGKTTVIIAHKLSTIEKADLIYLISDGVVKEYGTHEELLAKDGEYAAFCRGYKESRV